MLPNTGPEASLLTRIQRFNLDPTFWIAPLRQVSVRCGLMPSCLIRLTGGMVSVKGESCPLKAPSTRERDEDLGLERYPDLWFMW